MRSWASNLSIVLGLALGGIAVIVAAEPRLPEASPIGSAKRQAVLTRVHRQFRLADFFKPRRGDPIDFNYYLSPLICQEIVDKSAGRERFFGTVVRDGSNRFHVERGRPTVYAELRKVTVRGVQRDQLLFVWCYGVSARGRLKAQGLRVTLDREGYPVIMEVLVDSSGLRLVFVSSRLENAAARQFGRALRGCRYAVERPPEEHPNRLVVRAIDDGPAPMGPYVYLDAASRDVVNLRCRCASLQVQQFRKSVAYRFLPLSDLRLLGFRIHFATGTVQYEVGPRSEEPTACRSDQSRVSAFACDRWLRLPSSF
ncbi:MAG: hypothetical protein GXP27_05810 [Planctomycetes bacterium]|nr:hypothetical protein [Planctomycetota bacterium]